MTTQRMPTTVLRNYIQFRSYETCAQELQNMVTEQQIELEYERKSFATL